MVLMGAGTEIAVALKLPGAYVAQPVAKQASASANVALDFILRKHSSHPYASITTFALAVRELGICLIRDRLVCLDQYYLL